MGLNFNQLAKAAQELADLRKELAGVAKRYNRLIESDEPNEPVAEGKRIRRGLKTPQEAYHAPSALCPWLASGSA